MNYIFSTDVSLSKLIDFLEEVDKDYAIPLSEKTTLSTYAEKLLASATIEACIDDGKIVGLVAGYTENVPSHRLAYLSIVGVRSAYRRCGIADNLLKRFLITCNKRGIRGVHLYTDAGNKGASHLYESNGFTAERFAREKRPEDVHYLKLLNKVALVTAIGSFSASRVIDDLHSHGFRVVGCDIYPSSWVANSSKVDAFYQIPRATEQVDYIRSMREIVAAEKVAYILPSTDPEVDVFARLPDDDTLRKLVCSSDSDALLLCRDKAQCYENLHDMLGNNSIPTIRLSSFNASDFTFPVVCKPVNGRSSEGLFVAHSKEEIVARLANVDASKYCVQPMIDGEIVTVDVVRNADSDKSVAVSRLELLRTPNGAGSSVKLLNDVHVEELAKSVAAKLAVNGCVNMEFIRDKKGEYHFLECNPRFSGGVEFSCIAGYGCVINHLRCFIGLEIEDKDSISECYIARSYEAHVMSPYNECEKRG